MGDWKHHCDVLSVTPDASPEDIKAAFRQAALRLHPDKNGGTPASKEAFQKINISYRYLTRNLASRPAPAPPASSPPPPTPSSARFEIVRPPRFRRMEHTYPPTFPSFKRGLANGALPPTAAVFFFALLGIFAVICHNVPDAETGLPITPAAGIDESGRPVESCSILSFQHGRRIASEHHDRNEWDCELSCFRWFEAHRTDDISCSWNNQEFRRRSVADTESVPPFAKPASPAPPPGSGLRGDGFFDDPRAAPQVVYASGDDPEHLPVTDATVPVVVLHTKVGDHPQVEFPVAPIAWISDKKRLLGTEGTTRYKVMFTPIRPGEATVVVTDKLHRPIRTIHFAID